MPKKPKSQPKLNKKTPIKPEKLLKWLDEHILLVMSGFLLAFIPLFPKLPLFDILPGYIVRVRIEDILILLTGGIWLIQLHRGKVTLETPLTKIILFYAVAGLLSSLSAVFITKTVPAEPLHVGKTFLHFFRYLEYFSLFFFIFTSIKSKNDIKVLIYIILATLTLISVYGIGQKYLYWPVYSTMNREFSKGVRLYLTEHARVQSTFGGHYDLAAYLVIILPLILAFYYFLQEKKSKYLLGGVFILGLWLLIVSASRSSFIAFLISAIIVILATAFREKGKLKKILDATKKLFLFAVLISAMMLTFGDDMYDRLLQSLEGYPAIHTRYLATINKTRWFFTEYVPEKVGLREKDITQLQNFKLAEKPKNALSTEEAAILVASDQRPSTNKPSDVYVEVPDIRKVATISAEGNIEIIDTEVDRTYSDNAMKYGLSFAIRLDTLWPQALKGFYTNPLLGSGYATLTKSSIIQFTEAESTDNNFLRTLGETGLLGFITFYGAIVIAVVLVVKAGRDSSEEPVLKPIVIGFVAGTVGLLLNATYIDVFAASKVAFTYWSITGVALAATSKDLVDKKVKK